MATETDTTMTSVDGCSHCYGDWCQGLMDRAATQTTSYDGQCWRSSSLSCPFDNRCRRSNGWRCRSNAKGSITEVTVLVARDTTLTAVIRSMVLGVGSSGPINKPLAPATSIVEPSILLVCLKEFTCHTKQLKIFY